MRRIVNWGVMDGSMIINNYPFAEFRFWQRFKGRKSIEIPYITPRPPQTPAASF
jgi:hypothetical protein